MKGKNFYTKKLFLFSILVSIYIILISNLVLAIIFSNPIINPSFPLIGQNVNISIEINDSNNIVLYSFSYYNGSAWINQTTTFFSSLKHFAFDDGSGTNILNTGRLKGNGTASDSNIWTTDAKYGTSAINTTNYYAYGSSNLSNQYDMTVGLWFKLTDTINGSVASPEYLFDGSNAGHNDCLGTDPTSCIAFGFYSGFYCDASSTGHFCAAPNSYRSCYVNSIQTEWIANTWYYVAYTTNSSYVCLYVNGVVDSCAAKTGCNQNLQDFIIGGNYAGNSRFPGVIDDLMMFDKGLSAPEIYQLYLNGENTKHLNPMVTTTMPNLSIYNYTWFASNANGTIAQSDNYYINLGNPTYFSNNSVNNSFPTYGDNVLFKISMTDANGLNNYIFSYYNLTDWINISYNLTGPPPDGYLDSLVQFNLNEGTGNISTLNTGRYNIYNGTIIGNRWTTGKYNTPGWNTSYISSGSDIGSIRARSNISNSGMYSISMWIRPERTIDSTWPSTDGEAQDLFSGQNGAYDDCLGTGNPTSCAVIYFDYSFHGKVRFSPNGYQGGNVYSNRSNWTADQWYHIVATTNGTHSWIYVNGILDNDVSHPYSTSDITYFVIGRLSNWNVKFYGTIDYFNLFDRTLTASEVNQLYNVQLTGLIDYNASVVQIIPNQSGFNYTWYANDVTNSITQSDIFYLNTNAPTIFTNPLINSTFPRPNDDVNITITMQDTDGLISYKFSQNVNNSWKNSSFSILTEPPDGYLDSLVQYNFNEGNGSTTRNVGRYIGDNGTVIGNRWTLGKYNTYGWNTTGNDTLGSGDIKGTSNISDSGTVSISMWIKPNREINASWPAVGNDMASLFWGTTSGYNDCVGTSNPTSCIAMNFDSSNNGKLEFDINPYSNGKIKSNQAIWHINTWYHVVGVSNGTFSWIYINGILDNNVSHPLATADVRYFVVGRIYNMATSDNGRHFPGIIDNFNLFDRTLNESEISDLYNYGSEILNITSPSVIMNMPSQQIYNYTWYATDTNNIETKSDYYNFTINSPMVFSGNIVNITIPKYNQEVRFNITMSDYNGVNIAKFTYYNESDWLNDTLYSMNYCYQEDAATNNQTGIDGNCNLNYGGSYEFNGTGWINPGQVHDGNWGLGAGQTGGGIVYFNVTYYKPLTSTNAIWQVQSKDNPITNITIPSSCWDLSPDYIKVKGEMVDFTFNYYCYNSTNEILLHSDSLVSSMVINEEAMYWYTSMTKYATTKTFSIIKTMPLLSIYNYSWYGQNFLNDWAQSDLYYLNITIYELYVNSLDISPASIYSDGANNIDCNFNISDLNPNVMPNVSLSWFKNNISIHTYDYNFTNVNQNIMYTTDIGQGRVTENLITGDIWKCNIFINDSSITLVRNSSEIQILDAKPSVLTNIVPISNARISRYNTTISWAEVLTSSPICYQETANISTSCGGLSTGVYKVQNGILNWFQLDSIFDGDWSTGGYYGIESGNDYLNINYTKPIGTISNSLWQIKDAGILTNLSLTSCWNGYSDKIVLRIKSSLKDIDWYCNNGTDWVDLRAYSGLIGWIYEEGIFWNFNITGKPNTLFNTTILFNGSTILTTVDNGTTAYLWNTSNFPEGSYNLTLFSCNIYGCGNNYVIKNVTINSVPNLTIYTTPANLYNNDTLLSWITINDINNDYQNITYIWYNNNQTNQTGITNNLNSNIAININNVSSNNLQIYDNWMFSAQSFDGVDYSDWFNSSINQVLNRLLRNLTIYSPPNNTFSNVDLHPTFSVVDEDQGIMCNLNFNQTSITFNDIRSNQVYDTASNVQFYYTFTSNILMSDGCNGQIALKPKAGYNLIICLQNSSNQDVTGSCKTYTDGTYDYGSVLQTSAINSSNLHIGQQYRVKLYWTRIEYLNMDNSALNGYNDSGTNNAGAYDQCYSNFVYLNTLCDETVDYHTVYSIDSQCRGNHGYFDSGVAYSSSSGCDNIINNVVTYVKQQSNTCRIYEGYNRNGTDATGSCVRAKYVEIFPGCICQPLSYYTFLPYYTMTSCTNGFSGTCPSDLCTYAGANTDYSNYFTYSTSGINNVVFANKITTNMGITWTLSGGYLNHDGAYSWNISCTSNGDIIPLFSDNYYYIYHSTPPEFSNPQTDESNIYPQINDTFHMNLTLWDDQLVDVCILALNDTGIWQNKTSIRIEQENPIVDFSYIIQSYSDATHKNIAWQVWCNDSFNNANVSNIYSFTVKDVAFPLITLNPSGNFINNTVLSSYFYNATFGVTIFDYNLFQFLINATCDVSGQLYYYQELNYSSTTFTKNDIINLTNLPLQRCSFFVSAADDHTNKIIPSYEIENNDNNIVYRTPEQLSIDITSVNMDTVDIEALINTRKNINPGGKGTIGGKGIIEPIEPISPPDDTNIDIPIDDQIQNIVTAKTRDAYTFTFKYSEPSTTRSFKVHTDGLLFIRDDDKYLGHLVAWNDAMHSGNWIDFNIRDFNLTKDNYAASQIDDHNVIITITTDVPIQDYKFTSIGGLNIENMTWNFYIGGILNISSLNIYDNTSIQNFYVNITNLNSTPGKNISMLLIDNSCYQETATQSTSCGGLSSGQYSTEGNWTGDTTTLYDGNISTGCIKLNTTSQNATLYINYTLPPYTQGNTMWYIADNTTTVNNIIPTNCMANPVRLRIIVENKITGEMEDYFYCYNTTSSSWSLINTLVSSTLNEEWLIWGMNPSHRILEGFSNGTYQIDYSSSSFFDSLNNIINIQNLITSSIYSSYQSIVNFIFNNVKTGLVIPDIFIRLLNNASNYTVAGNSSTGITTFYVNASAYSVFANKSTFVDYTSAISLNPRQNITYTYNMNYWSTFNLVDERTLLPFNMSSATSVTFLLFCTDRTDQWTINTTSQLIPISCNYIKYKFVLIYGTQSYYRTYIVSPSGEDFNRTIYLMDLTNTQSEFNDFRIDDLLNTYQNPSIYIKKIIGNTTAIITSDYTDVEGKIGAYLIQNQEYIVEIHSDNQPVMDMGKYSADIAGEKILRLYTIGIGPSQVANWGNSVLTATGMVNESGTMWAIAYYNDTSNQTASVTWTLYPRNYGETPIFQDIVTNENNIEFRYNATDYLSEPIVSVLDVDYKSGSVHQVGQVIWSVTQIPLDVINDLHISRAFLDWFITLLLGSLALMATIRTANAMSLVLIGGATLFVLFKWFSLSWAILILAAIVALISFLKSEDKRTG